MKTILKVYSSLYRAREAMERDAKEVNSSGMDFRLRYKDGTLDLEVMNLCKIIYKTIEDPVMSFNGLTVDGIYFYDSLLQEDKLLISRVVSIKGSKKTSMKTEEFYYVVEDKVGSVTRTVQTNDKSLVEALFRET